MELMTSYYNVLEYFFRQPNYAKLPDEKFR